MFRYRHYVKKNSQRIEHFSTNEELPRDEEYYDSELASIDRVLCIHKVKNSENHATSEYPPDLTTYQKVKLILESPLVSYFYTPYRIYLMQSYIKGVDDLNNRRAELKASVAGSNDDISSELHQYDELEKQYEAKLPPMVPLPKEQTLVLVKWNNQTYDQVTWELEEDVQHEQSKIIVFRRNETPPDIKSIVSVSTWVVRSSPSSVGTSDLHRRAIGSTRIACL